jgi:MoaA/NifB/PqqE/SkfB family radical SAM enzyme
MTGDDWIQGLNRISPRADLPLSLQGGEPSLHPDFFRIVNGISAELHIDLLTNLNFDTDHFMRMISPDRMRRDSPYASIRVSYHPEVMDIESLAARVLKLQSSGYHIGVWGVLHPGYRNEILQAQQYCDEVGIDFRTKEFLGEYNGTMYGNLSFQDACDRKTLRKVKCKTSELLIGPGGDVYRCHSDLYLGRNVVGHILDKDFVINDSFRSCDSYGSCNPCDVKLKTNRFQEFGHTSVEIVKSKL